MTKVNKVELLNELQAVARVVERSTTIPVLKHIYMRVETPKGAPPSLFIAATDLEMTLTSRVEVEAESDPPPVAFAACASRQILDILKAMIKNESEEVELAFSDGSLEIKDPDAVFTARTLPADHFPTLPEVSGDTLSIPARVMSGLIRRTFHAISREESRFQLSGALFRRLSGDNLAMAATDGHRLACAICPREGAGGGDTDTEDKGILIPRKTLQVLSGFDSPLDIEYTKADHHLSFAHGPRVLISRILEGTFPDYKLVMKLSPCKKDIPYVQFVFDRETLIARCRQVALMTGDRSRAVKVEIDNEGLILHAANPDLGDATVYANLSSGCHHLGRCVGLNPDYIVDAISVLDTDRVRLRVASENDSVRVTEDADGPTFKSHEVLMPIRL